MHCTVSATTAMGTGTNRTFLCSALLSGSLFSTGFDPRTIRSLGEISTATAAWVPGIQVLVPYIYLSDSSEGASNIKRNLQDSNPGRGHGKAGPYLPGHRRLGFNVGIPGPFPVNRMNQNLRKQPGWTAKLSMSWNKMEILIHPTNFYNRGNTTAYHFWVGSDIPGKGCRSVNRPKIACAGQIAICMQSSSLYNRGFRDPWTWGSVEKTGLDGQNEWQLLSESHLEEIRDWKWAIFREVRHR